MRKTPTQVIKQPPGLVADYIDLINLILYFLWKVHNSQNLEVGTGKKLWEPDRSSSSQETSKGCHGQEMSYNRSRMFKYP